MRVTLHFHGYRYFPYERRWALRETETLFGQNPSVQGGVIQIDVPDERLPLLQRLTYFAKAVTESGEVVVPDQAKWEASANGGKLGAANSSVSRQPTRYSLHGLHEYKGRFNPQVVRAIGNLLRLEPGSRVLDPFCGSGTVLLEAAHLGWDALGVDLNPLAVMIANAKVDLFHSQSDELMAHLEAVLVRVGELAEVLGDCEAGFNSQTRATLRAAGLSQPLPGRGYLERWFPMDVLAQFQAVLGLIDDVPDGTARTALVACLSNLVRDVSLQDPGDLRIRRRKDPSDNYPALLLFAEQLTKLLSCLRSAAPLKGSAPTGTRQLAVHTDSRSPTGLIQAAALVTSDDSLFDAAITSPPYASALPYVDTQRLSLVLLGFADADDIYAMGRGLVGTREITTTQRREFEIAIESNQAEFPRVVQEFLADLLRGVRDADVGFRRRNRPALLYKYLLDMRSAFEAAHACLKQGSAWALVVGTNRTRLEGREIIIPTPDLLAGVAATAGFAVERIEPLDTYPRYGMHSANSINSESLVVLRAI